MSLDAAHKETVEYIPSFITPPGQTDVLLNIVIVFLICAVMLTGILYLRLHTLPEHIAHRANKAQIEIVAVLGLIALFTHNQFFWIAALLLAMIHLPDFLSPVRAMAASLRIIARRGLHQKPGVASPNSFAAKSDAGTSPVQMDNMGLPARSQAVPEGQLTDTDSIKQGQN